VKSIQLAQDWDRWRAVVNAGIYEPAGSGATEFVYCKHEVTELTAVSLFRRSGIKHSYTYQDVTKLCFSARRSQSAIINLR
jgi:hypothetical protein